jgi:UDP-N-acetylmuramate dehydrogenase
MLTIQSNVSLKPYNTFGIDVTVRYLVEIDSEGSLQTMLQLPDLQNFNKLILGGGSNILFTQPFEGVVVKIDLKGIEKTAETDQNTWLKVAAGEAWHDLVTYCVSNNYAGLENLSLIPGTVGAAPIQNIGAYGVELKDSFVSLEAIELATGQKHHFSHSDCQFGYRDSIFKHQAKGRFVITSVVFKLDKTPTFRLNYGDLQKTIDQMHLKTLTIKDVSDAVIKIRKSKLPDPADIGNVGSFFKNPEIAISQFNSLKSQFETMPSFPISPETIKIPAGWLIEQCGWKGKQVGNVGIHAKQALVLVNYGNGTGLEIKRLAERIQESVFDKFGISLAAEVNIV